MIKTQEAEELFVVSSVSSQTYRSVLQGYDVFFGPKLNNPLYSSGEPFWGHIGAGSLLYVLVLYLSKSEVGRYPLESILEDIEDE